MFTINGQSNGIKQSSCRKEKRKLSGHGLEKRNEKERCRGKCAPEVRPIRRSRGFPDTIPKKQARKNEIPKNQRFQSDRRDEVSKGIRSTVV